MSDDTSAILIVDEPRPGVLTLTMNDPGRRNALSSEMTDALREALTTHQGARVIVLRSSGKYFCAGGDLKSMGHLVQADRAARIEASRHFGELMAMIDTHPAVTIAEVNGPAYGGGVGIVAACDIVVCASRISFTLSEVTLGLTPSNIAPYIVRRLGPTAARRAMLTAPKLAADEALKLGLVDLVTDDTEAVVHEEVARILTCGPHAVAATKALIHTIATSSWEEAREAAAVHLADTWEREEAMAGLGAFMSKSKAPWVPGE